MVYPHLQDGLIIPARQDCVEGGTHEYLSPMQSCIGRGCAFEFSLSPKTLDFIALI